MPAVEAAPLAPVKVYNQSALISLPFAAPYPKKTLGL